MKIDGKDVEISMIKSRYDTDEMNVSDASKEVIHGFEAIDRRWSSITHLSYLTFEPSVTTDETILLNILACIHGNSEEEYKYKRTILEDLRVLNREVFVECMKIELAYESEMLVYVEHIREDEFSGYFTYLRDELVDLIGEDEMLEIISLNFGDGVEHNVDGVNLHVDHEGLGNLFSLVNLMNDV